MLRTILIQCTALRFAIDQVRLDRPDAAAGLRERMLDTMDAEGVGRDALEQPTAPGLVTLHMQVTGQRPVSHLIARLSDIDGVLEVGTPGESELD